MARMISHPAIRNQKTDGHILGCQNLSSLCSIDKDFQKGVSLSGDPERIEKSPVQCKHFFEDQEIQLKHST